VSTAIEVFFPEVSMFEGLFQPSHLLLILLLCVLMFGPKKLPELGKALGEGIRGFKDSMDPNASAKSEDPRSEKKN
jgi:sec-independent protein translocase protein TatA